MTNPVVAPGLPITATPAIENKRWSIDGALNCLSQNKAIKIENKTIRFHPALSLREAGAKDFLCRHNGYLALKANDPKQAEESSDAAA